MAKAKSSGAKKTITIIQVRSGAGRHANQRATLVGLGLNKLRRSSTLEDTPAVRGMINTVQHLVQVEES